ncbi:Transforming growth factor-beta-induced protein ig-h3 [Grifola frondosa]|uniref:Transforming growth factor-beta-induced protein ig-h3 n=1 Tax=Grifola frondosa TaxID=5627 RepID=A0A1C7MSJ1_GRIFR|nr:Transforming growth factor-beta-induced protein ig-h3 [Grifola frondosa]
MSESSLTPVQIAPLRPASPSDPLPPTMMRLSSLSVVLLTAVSSVLGQNTTFLTGLAQVLQDSGCAQLATIATTQLNASTLGQTLLGQVSSGQPFVFFAPNNQAFSIAPSNVTSDSGRLTDIVAYHMVPGNFSSVSTTYPNVTLGRTLLNDPSLVQLEGGKSQAIAWAIRADGKTHVLNQNNDSIVVNTTTFGNVTINVIDHVLNIPASFENTIPQDNMSLATVQTSLSAVSIPFLNASTNQASNVSLFQVLNTGLHGFTFFAPNNTAVQHAMTALQGLSSNATAIQALFQNHLINGSTVYSSELVGQTFTSAAGETLSFSFNATGQYVTSGNTTARIVQPDVLLTNGVIHVIDNVLVNTQSDASAASSAASSASSAATQSTSQTAPIGASQTASLTGSSSSGAGSPTGSNNAASIALRVPGAGTLVGMGFALVGVLLGGLMTLA